jgi:hypothetical protein
VTQSMLGCQSGERRSPRLTGELPVRCRMDSATATALTIASAGEPTASICATMSAIGVLRPECPLMAPRSRLIRWPHYQERKSARASRARQCLLPEEAQRPR